MPWEGTGDRFEPGAVTVLYGADGGLTAERAQHLTQASPGVPGSRGQYDSFGSSLAIADYGRSWRDDLAIGAQGSKVSGVWRAGELNVLYGRAAGLTATGAQLWSQASPGVPGAPEQYDAFGFSLTP